MSAIYKAKGETTCNYSNNLLFLGLLMSVPFGCDLCGDPLLLVAVEPLVSCDKVVGGWGRWALLGSGVLVAVADTAILPPFLPGLGSMLLSTRVFTLELVEQNELSFAASSSISNTANSFSSFVWRFSAITSFSLKLFWTESS